MTSRLTGKQSRAERRIFGSTSQATTSGTSYTFSPIPSGVRFMRLQLIAVGFTGGSDWLGVQFGTSGGIVTPGYTSNYADTANSGGASTDAFVLCSGSFGSGTTFESVTDFVLLNRESGLWGAHTVTRPIGTIPGTMATGTIALSGKLTQLKLYLIIGTTAAFNTGNAHLSYWN